MDSQRIISTQDLNATLHQLLHEISYDHLFVLTDEHTAQLCLPRLIESVSPSHLITIPSGDESKYIGTLSDVWEQLSTHGATRHSLLVNVGGGMVTDLGGFAAATYKRGIPCINIPTTLLAMVDAAVGGKTGINFHSLKNEIGAFYPAYAVVIFSGFLSTLDKDNLVSGFAEMLKHGLISTRDHWSKLMRFDWEQPHFESLQSLIMESIAVKEDIVAQDPKEQGIRKALNLGHTLGHAFETMLMRRGDPCLHGYAVVWGLIGELYLSHVHEGFPSDILRQTITYIKEVYGICPFTCKHYDELYELMLHDKKNRSHDIRFTLLADIGDIRLDCVMGKEDIFEMLDFVREG